jgi:hypothetical protein
LPEQQLSTYINILKHYFNNNILKQSHNNGKNITAFIYFDEHNNTIENFKNYVLYENNDINNPRVGHFLQKLNFESIKSQELNFSSQTSDFLDSILKIGLVGICNNDLSVLSSKIENGCLGIKEIVNIIKQSTWTERKETRRTIEHFEKVVFTNEESELVKMAKRAKQNYEDKLLEIIPSKNNLPYSLSKYCIADSMYSGTNTEYGLYTQKVINLFLYEHIEIPEGFLTLLKEAYDFNLRSKMEEKDTKLSFYEFKSFIQSNGDLLRKHKETFNTSNSVIENLAKLTTLLLDNNKPINVAKFSEYLAIQDKHFIRTYTDKLSVYAGAPLIETIYNHYFAGSIDKSTAKTAIIQQIETKKQQITSLRISIGQITDELKEIFRRDEPPFEYSTKLGDFSTKILIGIEKLLNDDNSISVLIVCREMLGYADTIISAATDFNRQINQIKNVLQSKFNTINSVQEKVDNIYSDTLYKNVLSNVKKIDKPNYWGKIMLSTIKAIQQYDFIFKNREDYAPNNKKRLETADLDAFIQQANAKFEEKKTSINDIQQKINTAVEEVDELLKLENELKELLKTEE